MRGGALLGVLALAAGCASAPRAPAVVARAPVVAPAPAAPPLPELAFRAGEPPRRAVIVAGVIAAPAAAAATLDALSRRLAVPAPLGQELLRALSDGALPLTRAQLDRLDPARPIGLVSLAHGIGVDAGTCVAATFKDAAGARQTVAELGRELGRSGGESERELPGGETRYLGVHGRTLLISSTRKTIVVAGPLAEELQERPAPSAARLTFYPHVVMPVDAAAIGAIVEARGPAAIADLQARAAKDGFPFSAPAALALVRLVLEAAAETRAVTLAVELSESAGLAANLTIEPVAESAFARALARQFPFAQDPQIPAAASAGLMSWGGYAEFMTSLGPVFAASGPKGRALRATNEALLAQLRGPYSCAIDRGARLGWRCAWPLRAGARPADVLRRYAAFVEATVAWSNEACGTHAPPPLVTATKGALDVERRADPAAKPAVAAWCGATAQRSAATVRGGSLIVAQGGDPRALLNAPVPAGSAPAALEAARGANFVAAIDLAAIGLSFAAASEDSHVKQGLRMIRAIPGLESLSLPVIVTARSGATARYELQLPFESLQNAARVVVPFMGTMGGAAPGP